MTLKAKYLNFRKKASTKLAFEILKILFILWIIAASVFVNINYGRKEKNYYLGNLKSIATPFSFLGLDQSYWMFAMIDRYAARYRLFGVNLAQQEIDISNQLELNTLMPRIYFSQRPKFLSNLVGKHQKITDQILNYFCRDKNSGDILYQKISLRITYDPIPDRDGNVSRPKLDPSELTINCKSL